MPWSKQQPYVPAYGVPTWLGSRLVIPAAYTSNADSSARRWLSATCERGREGTTVSTQTHHVGEARRTEIFLDELIAELAKPADIVGPTLEM